MKKFILLLIAPLLFFNSCEEEEDESNCPTSPIQCGEIMNVEVYPPIESGANTHSGYSIVLLKNCDSGNVGTYCTNAWNSYSIDDIGGYICPNSIYTSDWQVESSFTVINNVIIPIQTEGCFDIGFATGDLVTFN